jgi:hypothetical protein
MLEFELPLRITLVNPPVGVLFALQRRKDELVDPKRSTAADLSFDLTIRIKGDPDLGSARFLGEFVQGPTGAKFVYVRVGTMAGDHFSPWTRRVKIPLAGLNWDKMIGAHNKPKHILEARIPGADRKGEPICASVKLLGAGWQLVKI